MLPQGLKRRGVDLAKKVLGDATLQSRADRQVFGRRRKLGLAVALDGPESGAFATERISQVEPSAQVWRDLTHLDGLVTSAPPGVKQRAQIERLRPCIVDPRSVLPPISDELGPTGFDADQHRCFLAITGSAEVAPGVKRLAPPGREVEAITFDSLPDVMHRPDRWRRMVQRHLGLLDQADHWSSVLERATTLTRVAACGVPVVVPPDQVGDLGSVLPQPVLQLFSETVPFDLVDPGQRDQIAKAQWLTVHRHCGQRATWNRILVASGRRGLAQPRISVIVATNRPGMIANWAPQIAAQVGVDWECVVVLHGGGFHSEHESHIHDFLGDRVTVLRAPTAFVLGDLLSMATQAASGDLIVKWDDDDLYDLHHLADLATTYEYSGATVVGKAAEYVYLAGPDVTVQRNQGRRETFSATLAGGTLCIGRGDLNELGGWRRAPRRVDSLLIEDVLAAGGLSYRAIGLGYIMVRAGSIGHAHTWDMGDEQFLDSRFVQRRGLDTGFAGTTTDPQVVKRWSRAGVPA
jgi:hypothetical protein